MALAKATGQLHDIGKTSADFQTYIRQERGTAQRVDHSTAGARVAIELYGPDTGKLLAFAIAGHHSGLTDGPELARRLDPARTSIPVYDDWKAQTTPPSSGELTRYQPPRGPHRGFSQAFFVRMLFSCLVDADFVETEGFYARQEGRGDVERDNFTDLTVLADRLQAHLRSVRKDDTELNRLRSRVLDHTTAKAVMPPGLFTLTVPTGGGKTLTSLSFALEHARIHGLRRVIYVIPFTSIIEQTAAVFRKALATRDDVLEHHASFDWEAEVPRNARPDEADAGEGRDGLAKLRRAAENWASPVVVTTAVQFFESLFANRTSRCRKLHNLAGSVIVLDEAQTLPLHLLRPCMAATDELARNYGASVVLCTATQPALRVQDGFVGGLEIGDDRELAPDPPALYAQLRRVAVERRPGETRDAEIAARFAEAPQMLCIVNSRAHASDLHKAIKELPGAVHLTTLMCPRHRRAVLAEVRERLRVGAPVRLVATSLIEAGVDVDFPEVWRASAGLDQIAQAAGRCNREGKAAGLGRVVVFEPTADHRPPHALRALQQAASGVLRRHPDPLTLEAVNAYFRQLYWTKQEAVRDAFDAARLDGVDFPILRKIAERASTLDFPFESIARAFRLIEQAMEPVIVPWDNDACDVLHRIAAMDRPLASDLRWLQQYVVPIPPRARADWLQQGVLRPVHPKLGDALLQFDSLAHYDASTGVRLDDPTYRTAERNVL